MPRPPVDTNLAKVALQPAASPVQSFVQAPQAEDRQSGLMSVARSLAGFSGELRQLLSDRDKKQQEEDAIKAQADFIKNNSEGYDEATKRGLIPAQASPAYVKAYKEAQGAVAGDQLTLEVITAYDQWPGKNDLDPTAFNTFMSGFLKDRLGTQDPDVLRGYLPKIQAARAALLNKRYQEQDVMLRQGSKDAISAQGNNAIDDAHAAGLANGEPNYEGTFAAMEASRAKFSGMADADAEEALLGVVVAKAIEKEDPKILDFFKRKVPGKDYAYKDTPSGQKAYMEAISKLDVVSRQNKAEKAQAQREADRLAKEQTQADALAIISKDPKAPLPDELMKRGEKYDGSFKATIAGWRNLFADAAAKSDPDALAHLTKEMMDDPTKAKQAVIETMRRGVMSPSDFQTYYRFAEDIGKDGGKNVSAVLSLPQVSTVMGAIKKRTAPGVLDWQANPDGITNDGLRAQSDFRRQLLMWAAANPEAAKDPIKAGDAADKIGAAILGSIAEPGVDDAGRYTAPDGGKGNPYGENAPPAPPPPPAPVVPEDKRSWYERVAPEFMGGLPAPTAADAQTPPPAQAPAPPAPPAASEAPAVTQVDPKAYETFVNGLPPAARSSLERSLGMAKDPEAYKARVMKRFEERMGAATPAPDKINFAPEEDQGGIAGLFQQASIDGDAAVAAINTALDDAGIAAEIDQEALAQFAEEAFDDAFDEQAPAAAASPGRFTTSGVPDGTDIAALPAGMRNFNPGNLKFSGSAWQRANLYGIAGPSRNTDQGDPQIVFRSAEEGMASAAKLALVKFDGGKTSVMRLITDRDGWTPGNTQAARNIAASMGVDPNAQLDLRDPAQMTGFMRALIRQEHGDAGGLYADDLIRSGVEIAMGRREATGSAPNYEDGPASADDVAFLSGRLHGGAKARKDSLSGANPQMVSRVAQLFRMAPPEIQRGLGIYSGYRSKEVQAQLWAAALKKYGSAAAARKWVAPPGGSRHNHGDAMDLAWNGRSLKNAPRHVVQWLHANAGQVGLKFPLGNENWHVEMVETRGGKKHRHRDDPLSI